jgi:FdrA protein
MEGVVARVVIVRKNQYFDSVFLMAVAARLAKEVGIDDAAAVMGTDANRRTLAEMGFDAEQFAEAGPNDLLVALRGQEDAIRAISDNIVAWLVRKEDSVGSISVPTWDAARKRLPDANLAVVSVPGAHAAREAHTALDAGLNVFLFSDHVTIEDELALKKKAQSRGLLVMGPDCGTAIIAGKGIGFANVVRRGPIGVVASSGTGLQEFTCLVHRAGSGISHALGTGSHDLSDAIGGISTLAGLRVLDADPSTRAMAVISKPPGGRALRELVHAADRCVKPVALCLLGLREGEASGGGHARVTRTLDEAAAVALEEVGGRQLVDAQGPRRTHALLDAEIARVSGVQQYLRGLFAGGTFCYQAQQILRDAGIVAHSNAPISGMLELPDPLVSWEHSLVDMGADEFTDGKPHPMIDASQRSARILAEGQDRSVAILLIDVVLGYNAAADPAGDIAPAIREAKHLAKERGGSLIVLASVCGTDEDPQDLSSQERILSDAGAHVFESSLGAVEAAVHALHRLAAKEAR